MIETKLKHNSLPTMFGKKCGCAKRPQKYYDAPLDKNMNEKFTLVENSEHMDLLHLIVQQPLYSHSLFESDAIFLWSRGTLHLLIY